MAAFSEALGPKWDHDKDDGELIDDAARFDRDKEQSKRNYEEGMARAFRSCHSARDWAHTVLTTIGEACQEVARETLGKTVDWVFEQAHTGWTKQRVVAHLKLTPETPSS